MELRDVQRMAWKLMIEYRLTSKGWTFQFDNARRRLGNCKHEPVKIISVSRYAVPYMNEDQVRNILLHEIAHAIVGPRNGHNHVWREQHIAMGGDGKRCGSVDRPVEGRYRAECPNGHLSFKHRRSRHGRERSCGKCSRTFDRSYLLEWYDTKYNQYIGNL